MASRTVLCALLLPFVIVSYAHARPGESFVTQPKDDVRAVRRPLPAVQ